MFTKILVPLDGSALAENALPAAASMAAALRADVTLFHVIEAHAPESVHNDRHLTKADEAREYLQQVARKYFHDPVSVDWHVHEAGVKDVAESICAHADEFEAGLIVMCTHGRSGMREMLFGSIAQQVLSSGGRSVLLLRPAQPNEIEAFDPKRILLPLDSRSEHDQVFPYAIALAQAYQAEIAMLTVIPTFGTLTGEHAAASSLLPGTTAALLDIEEQEGRQHLQAHLEEMQGQGLGVSFGIARGDPAAGIVAAGARWKADLMILGTHRRAGIDAFWARSVAPHIARNTRIPVLLLPMK